MSKVVWCLLEHLNVFPVSEKQIIINCQEEDEGQEERCGREEVPHVMIVKEVHDIAKFVFVPENECI